MAPELTYDPTPADQPEFNEAEQEALAIGEAQYEEENKMLAGKFEDAEALEQAYIELQKKLGEPKDESEESEGELQGDEEAPEEEVDDEIDPIIERLDQASAEWAENGELSDETIAELTEMSSEDLITAYLAAQQNAEVGNDFSDADVQAIQADVGGAEAYDNLMSWAQSSLPEAYIDSYNALVDKGDPTTVRLALAGLQAAFNENNGYEGDLLSGRGAVDTQDAFRSQAEVVAAMQDPRYDTDPAYRQDVFAKLEASNIDY